MSKFFSVGDTITIYDAGCMELSTVDSIWDSDGEKIDTSELASYVVLKVHDRKWVTCPIEDFSRVKCN